MHISCQGVVKKLLCLIASVGYAAISLVLYLIYLEE